MQSFEGFIVKTKKTDWGCADGYGCKLRGKRNAWTGVKNGLKYFRMGRQIGGVLYVFTKKLCS